MKFRTVPGASSSKSSTTKSPLLVRKRTRGFLSCFASSFAIAARSASSACRPWIAMSRSRWDDGMYGHARQTCSASANRSVFRKCSAASVANGASERSGFGIESTTCHASA